MKSRFARKVISAVLLLTICVAGMVLADDALTFGQPDVNKFVKAYAQFVDDYADAYKAVKAGDSSKLQALQAKSLELQTEARQLTGKIKASETQRFSDFINKYAQKLVNIAKEE